MNRTIDRDAVRNRTIDQLPHWAIEACDEGPPGENSHFLFQTNEFAMYLRSVPISKFLKITKMSVKLYLRLHFFLASSAHLLIYWSLALAKYYRNIFGCVVENILMRYENILMS